MPPRLINGGGGARGQMRTWCGDHFWRGDIRHLHQCAIIADSGVQAVGWVVGSVGRDGAVRKRDVAEVDQRAVQPGAAEAAGGFVEGRGPGANSAWPGVDA